MTAAEKRKVAGKTEFVLFLLLLAGGLLLVWGVAGQMPPLSREAEVRAGVAHDLLTGETRGRQGFVGSLYWAPLPTLLIVLLVRMAPPFGGAWAPVWVAVASGALLCACICAWLRRCGLRTATRITISIAIFLSPALQRPIMSGSSAPLFALLTAGALCFLAHWWETDQLRSLAYLAVSLALALVTSYHAAVLLAAATVVVVLRLFLRRRRRSYAEATLIVFLTPGLYLLALWAVSNWLIMGRPGFFVRGLPGWGESWRAWAALLFDGCNWEPALVLWAMVLVGWGVGAILNGRRTLWTAVPVIAATLLLWTGPARTTDLVESGADMEFGGVVAELRATHGDDWIILSGYRGYELGSGSGHFHHTLSFYLDQALENTRGKRAYLLVPAPRGRDRWEDVNLKFPAIFEKGSAFTIYEKSWRHWRLWRIVRMDETDQR